MTAQFDSHSAIPGSRDHGPPVLYVDVNGKEWIVIVMSPDTLYTYDIENDLHLELSVDRNTFVDTKYNVGRARGLIKSRFSSHECVIDNNRHILYWYDGKKSITSLDISGIANAKAPSFLEQVTLPKDSKKLQNFQGGYDCILIGNQIHFLFGKQWLGHFAQHYTFDINTKKFDLIDENFEETYFQTIDFSQRLKDMQLLNLSNTDNNNNNNNINSTNYNDNKNDNNHNCKRKFINNLSPYDIIDVSHRRSQSESIYFPAIIEHLVFEKNREAFNEIVGMDRKISKNTDDVNDRYAYVHYCGWSSKHDEWITLTPKNMCDCYCQCSIKRHGFTKTLFALPMTQCLYRQSNKGRCIVYSKKHEKLIILGRDKGLLCSKDINCKWYDYYNQIDFNGKQSYYNGDKNPKAIEKHYYLLIVSGYLKNYNRSVEIPKDLCGIVLRYYWYNYYSSDNGNGWSFIKNDKMPLTCNSRCVLLDDENTVIIFEDGKVYIYNIGKNEFNIKIKQFKMPKKSKVFAVFYSKKMKRIYFIERHGRSVNSIKLSDILSNY